jgi:AraC-like DNA-binding protein
MTAFLPIVRSATLEGFPALARELGLDASALLRKAGLHPRSLLDPETPLAAEAVGRLLEASAAASGRADFGLKLAARRRFESLGPISLLLKEQPSVGEALETLLRYLRLINPSLVTRVVTRDWRVFIQEDLQHKGAESSPQSIELALGIMFNILQELLGPRWKPVSVHFRHPGPTDLTVHQAFFSSRVLFRAGLNGIALRPADLQTPPQGGDPGLARLVRHVLEGALAREQGPAMVVRQLVVALLPGGGCTAQLVARHLGVDRRTLHRYLAAHGLNFSGLLQTVRRDLVLAHLAQAQLPLSESAALLGFASQSAFAYWFRMQFGCSVTRWRQAQSGSSLSASAAAPGQTGRRTNG